MLSTGLKIWIGSSMKKYKYIYYYVSIFYTIGISLWSGTIYLFMKHIGYTYGQINLFLGIFWVITFFAEIPSGYIADKVGYLKTIMFSGFVRGIGLLLLAISPRNLHWMVISGVLTAIGDSLQSGTMDSWIANKATKYNNKNQLSEIYLKYSMIALPLTMVATFVGANILGNIDLNLPLIIGALFLIICSLTVIPLLKYDVKNISKLKNFTHKLNLIKDIKNTVAVEKKTLYLILFLMPVAIISSGPLDQWQLYFQKGKSINSGTISVCMTLAGMLATTIYNRIVSKHTLKYKKQINIIVVSTMMMTATIWGVVLTRQYYYVSLSIFMIHTMFGSVENMVSGIVLQTTIKTEKRRATIVSISNALDAGIEVIVLSINGYLSDHYGIGLAWASLAIIGLMIFIIGFLIRRRSKDKESEVNIV